MLSHLRPFKWKYAYTPLRDQFILKTSSNSRSFFAIWVQYNGYLNYEIDLKDFSFSHCILKSQSNFEKNFQPGKAIVRFKGTQKLRLLVMHPQILA
jgi:hypothetical protein